MKMILTLLHFLSWITLAYCHETNVRVINNKAQKAPTTNQWYYNRNYPSGSNINNNGPYSTQSPNSVRNNNGLNSRNVSAQNTNSLNSKNDFTKPDQCPCFRQQGTTGCFEYDLRRQAINFEEAVVYFPDILFDKADSLKPLSERRPMNSWCQNDPYCKDCANPFMTHLHMKGYLDDDELKKERQNLGYNPMDTPYNMGEHSDCWKLRFTKPAKWDSPPPYGGPRPFIYSGPSPRPLPPPSQGTQNGQWQTSAPTHRENDMVDALIKKGSEFYENQRNRGKRQIQNNTTNQTTANLGQVYQIDCIKRGDTIDSNGDWVSLCDICWVWRRLPSMYFPTYLNEFICGNDTKCLSGYGECKQRTRPVDLLQNFGTEANPIWRAITIGSSTFCECEARFGSEFHRLIAS